jgi:hypothetical protein
MQWKMAQVTALTLTGNGTTCSQAVGQVATIVVDAKETVKVTHAEWQTLSTKVFAWLVGHVNNDLTRISSRRHVLERDIKLGESPLSPTFHVMLSSQRALICRRIACRSGAWQSKRIQAYWLRRQLKSSAGV